MATQSVAQPRGDWKNLTSHRCELDWDPADVSGSLNAVNSYAEDLAVKAIEWYYKKKRFKSNCSRLFRYGGILCTALAGMLPILSAAWPRALASFPALQPANGNLVVSLLVGLTATLIAIDRFGGFSTAWIRYIRTAAEIQKSLYEYRLDWVKLLADAGITGAIQPAPLLARTREFVLAVQALVIQETGAWAAEFENNLSQMEKSAKEQSDKQFQDLHAKLDRAQPGSLFITVTNLPDLDGGRFTIVLFSNTERIAEALDQKGSWQHLGLAAGLYTAHISAVISGKAVSKTVALAIEIGKPRHESIVMAQTDAVAK
jgi:hypothetical protein